VLGKTFTQFWQRDARIDGSYIFEKGDNLDNYFTAAGFPSTGTPDMYLLVRACFFLPELVRQGCQIVLVPWYQNRKKCTT
jgi:hypothetical protein